MWGGRRNKDDSPVKWQGNKRVRSAQWEPIQIKKRAASMEDETQKQNGEVSGNSEWFFWGDKKRLKVEKDQRPRKTMTTAFGHLGCHPI